MPPPTWGGGVAASQAVLEALVGGSALPPGVVCSQVVLEALYSSAGNLAASQIVMEVLLLSTTTIIFPASISRAPRVDELRETTPDTTLRSQMDVGPDKLRRRASAGVRTFEAVLDVTRTQVATLDAFYQADTAGGTLPFQWKNPRTGNTADFRFSSRPQYQPRAPRGDGTEFWRATFGLELLPGTET
jgi:hypothetical protein